MCLSVKSSVVVPDADPKDSINVVTRKPSWESEEQASLALWLEPWLESIKLPQYLRQVVLWCELNGAAEVQELEEYWEELSEHLGLCGEELEIFSQGCTRKADSADSSPSAQRCDEFLQNSLVEQSTCSEEVQHLDTFGPTNAPYALSHQLGQGASAVVYRCTRGDEQFAAKVVGLKQLKQMPKSADILHQMNREIAFLWTLRHPQIVQLHDVVEEPNRLILVMELLEGGTLFDHITSKSRLEPDEARSIFAQVAEGVGYMHSKHIIHRDLKPENILLVSKPVLPEYPDVKISDFGHSKAIRDGYSRALSTVGTRQYWAPEVEECGRVYDERVDLWSLGIVLYVMVVGRYPFRSHDRKMDFQFKGSREIDELVRGLIRIRPEERMSLEHCLQSPWLKGQKRNASAPQAGYEASSWELRLRLPRAPTDVVALQAELSVFSRKHKAAARLEVLDVIATLRAEPASDAAQELEHELTEIMLRYAPGLISQASTEGGGDWRLGPFNEEAANARREELESLKATYGEELHVVSEAEWVVKIDDDASLRVHLTAGYPATEPPRPIVEGAAMLLPHSFADEQLVGQWMSGEFCICQWVERLRDAVAEARGQGEQSSSKERFAGLVGTWAQRELSKLSPGETMVFPPYLTSFHRLVLHQLCHHLGWRSDSKDVPIEDLHSYKSASATRIGAIPAGEVRWLPASKEEAKKSEGRSRRSAKPFRQISVTRSLQRGAMRPKDVALKDFLPVLNEPAGNKSVTAARTVTGSSASSR